MKVAEIGEFGLIRLIISIINKKSDKTSTAWNRLLIAAGDDSAAWKTGMSVQLATTDIMIEGIHFDLVYTGWHDLGWKAIVANISDIAAMGGKPSYALVSLALPGDIEAKNISLLYEGILDAANKYGVAVAGGNISFSKNIIINITVLGRARGSKLLKRTSAQHGNCIAVTGYPGLAAAGRYALSRKLNVTENDWKILAAAHLRPIPRVLEAQVLLKNGVMAAIDSSDGLVADLTHLCEASAVSANLYEGLLPLHPTLKKHFAREALKLALSGGEDYELIFAADKATVEIIQKQLDIPVTIIGEFTKGKAGNVRVFNTRGKLMHYEYTGWDHYASLASTGQCINLD